MFSALSWRHALVLAGLLVASPAFADDGGDGGYSSDNHYSNYSDNHGYSSGDSQASPAPLPLLGATPFGLMAAAAGLAAIRRRSRILRPGA